MLDSRLWTHFSGKKGFDIVQAGTQAGHVAVNENDRWDVTVNDETPADIHAMEGFPLRRYAAAVTPCDSFSN